MADNFIISPEITLLIADHADSKTISALQRLNNSIYCLLMTYQHSIVKARIHQLIPEPSLQPPLGSLFSSHGPERQILSPYSFDMLREIELRQTRIDALLNVHPQMPLSVPPPLIQAMSQIPSFAALPIHKQTLLVEMYKSALQAVDQIADQAVLVKSPEMSREIPTDPYVIERSVHRARQAWIRGLTPLQFSLVSSLACLCGMAYMREHPQLNSDPGFMERVTAFKETVLRQGSFAVWGFLHPSDIKKLLLQQQQQPEGQIIRRSPSQPPRARGNLAVMVARRMDDVLKEMEVYESGLNENNVPVDDNGDNAAGEGGEQGAVFAVLDGLLQTVNGMAWRLVLDGGDGEEDGEDEDLRVYPGLRVILRALKG
ncbi:hypothetical protein QBC38DRAFT_22279 [Podospora fimiseda]|uniref:Uncharacterized protein n=1 Tax=Podospora fimiseda TaxID=252190 RepID=A0AAN7BWC4_9PEZI|nr:hypothetical protein QBC38DRAFT_22279 [Podospora fimiseda]